MDKLKLFNPDTPKIISFQGEYRFLSNFWPVNVVLGDILFSSVEHAYQAGKTDDINERYKIRDLATPGQAKRAGKKLKLRSNWDDNLKWNLMYYLVFQKFKNTELREKLIATGDAEIIEGNTWGDTYWGVCNGVGKNHLGKILMLLRMKINQ